MRVIHLLRKYDPAEWGGTESALQRLFDGLRRHGVTSIMYCPRLRNGSTQRPAKDGDGGCAIRRFHACVPIWGLSEQQRHQFIAVGGNLMSFDLLPLLWREPDISVIHTHALGRLGAMAAAAARRRRVPFVITIHGGLLDLPETLKNGFRKPAHHGIEWGKLFGFLLQSRRLVSYADAILTCNPKEAALLREQQPGVRIEVQPHGVVTNCYRADHRAGAREAFPIIRDRMVLLCVGRIDPVKNQGWLITEAPKIFRKHPDSVLVLAGACTDAAYGESIQRQIRANGLEDRILLTGGLPPEDPRLIGLFQEARLVMLPSISETFGLVILEAWAAGTAVLASRTSGASALIRPGDNGWLFDLDDPQGFHRALDTTLFNPECGKNLGAAGRRVVAGNYDLAVTAGRVKQLYQELSEARHALRHSA